MDAVASTSSTETVTVAAPRPAKASHLWAGKSFGFSDLLDTINPLQHIPVVGSIYRAVTGDTIGNAARVAGDALFGGVVGVISGLVDVAVKEVTGEDVGEHVLATLGIHSGTASPSTQDVASQPPAASDPPPGPSSSAEITPVIPPSTPGASTSTAASSPQTGNASPPIPDTDSALPKFGSATTSGMLSAAAPVTPLDMMKALPPTPPTAKAAAPAGPYTPHFIPIDTSDQGIMAMRARSGRSPEPIALNVPAGTLPPSALPPSSLQPATDAKPVDFVAKMREGLDKYEAMMKARSAPTQAVSVNQLQ